jgi:hypothetical protein
MITMLHGGGASDFERACFNVPTLSNLYKEAAYRAQISRDLPAVERQIERRMARRAARGVARPIQQAGARAIGRPASKRA